MNNQKETIYAQIPTQKSKLNKSCEEHKWYRRPCKEIKFSFSLKTNKSLPEKKTEEKEMHLGLNLP